jgi:hypothetical protein
MLSGNFLVTTMFNTFKTGGGAAFSRMVHVQRLGSPLATPSTKTLLAATVHKMVFPSLTLVDWVLKKMFFHLWWVGRRASAIWDFNLMLRLRYKV